MCSSVDGSRTTNLSLADRAVCFPVFITTGPSFVIVPSLRKTISS